MANLISVTSFSGVSNGPTNDGTTASEVLINVENIISVKALDTAYETTGVTLVNYNVPTNNTVYQVGLIVEETVAEVLAAANAPLA